MDLLTYALLKSQSESKKPDYSDLENKPTINGIPVEGNITTEDLGITNGIDGKDGADGKDGNNGNDGKDGKSAYEYAREGGYTGSEEQFGAALAKLLEPEAVPEE